MEERFFPFNAVEDELEVPDRQYDAVDFARYFSQFISNGVYPNPSSGLQVQSLYSNMVLTISDGSGFINGYGYVLDSEGEPLTVRVNDSHASYNRKDTIVLQLDLTARKINLIYKAGTASANPLPPPLVRNADIYELQLAEVLVKSGVSSVSNADITDTRLDTSLCGIVHNTVDQIDTTTLYAQIQADLANFNAQEKADFLAWFNGIKDILDESTAGNLLNLINGKAAANHIGINATATHNTNVVEITAPTDAVQIIFEAPSDFAEADSYTLNGTAITLTDLNNEPLFNAWKQGATVPLIIKDGKAFFKSGGGAYGTLSPQIKGFTANAGNHQIMLNWQNPSDANHAGTYIVRKQGSQPTKLSDGVKIDVGIATAYTDNEPENDLLYYYRAFPYNAKKQVQTELTGAVVSATPKAGILAKDLPNGTLVVDPNSQYNNVPIEWRIVSQWHWLLDSGYPENSTTLMCEKIISFKCFDAKEPDNPDSNRKSGGNNRWVLANLRTFSNSDENAWYQERSSVDEPPTSTFVSGGFNPYSTENGFKTNLSAGLKAAIKEATITTAKAVPVEGGGTDAYPETVFLASKMEVGLGSENNINEGARFDYFTSSTKRIAYPTQQAVDANQDTTQGSPSTSSPWMWRLRSAKTSTSAQVWNVAQDGTTTSYTAFRSDYGFRPFTNISNTTLVELEPNPDGSYNLIL